MDLDTLRADPQEFLARLLNVDPSSVTPEFIEAKLDEARERCSVVPLTTVTCSAHLDQVARVQAFTFNCEPSDDTIQDAAAELQQGLLDIIDLAGDLSPPELRRCLTGVFEVVEHLAALGAVVSVGVEECKIQATPLQVTTRWVAGFVVVSPKDAPKKFAIVDKTQPLGW